MGRLCVMLSPILWLPFVLGLAIIHGQPSSSGELRAFLGTAASACRPPCFMGIRPGVTRIDEVSGLLMASGWVGKLYLTEAPAAMAWDWNGQQPRWIDASSPGHLATDNDAIVSYIDIQTTIPAASLWLAYGPPPRGFITTRPRLMTHFIGFPEVGVDAYVQVACPATSRRFWNARAYVYWGVAWRPSTADNDYPGLWRQHLTC